MPKAAPKSSPRTPATVTRAFLFSDLRGYTEFVETHGDSAASDLLRAYRDLVRAEVGKHSGAEVKTEGDSFYVVFESPKAALDCAVGIQRAAAEHAGRDTKAPLRIGVGLHAGETVPYDDQFVGGAVNVAARLASKAKAGEIVASDTLRGLVRTAVRYQMADRGPLKLKGVDERLRAYTVEWREDAPRVATAAPTADMPLLQAASAAPIAPGAPGQIVCPVVVGRDVERARFIEHLELAAGGSGRAVIVDGEAGVGKSAFVREALAASSERGFRILYGATLESDGGLPYAPFVAAVRSGFRGIARDRLGRVLGQAAPDLAQLFPELGKAQRSETATSVEQHRLSVAFLGLFATFAREAPVLLVVEDLHWADEASLGLFHYLARELRDSRVLLLGTYRSDEMHRRHPLLRVLSAMRRERVVSEISLARLDREQVRSLILATFRQKDPNIRVSDEFRDAIYDRSEGNPYFTEELLKSLVESGDVYYRPESGWERKPIDQMRIPGSVREAVRERIDRLTPDARTTLSTAAVIGLRVPFELLRAVRAVAEAELEAHLPELIEQQLVTELGRDDDYGFRHALTKEVVYDDLLVRERKRLHRSVADALIADPRSEPALVAHHLLGSGDGQAAVPHLISAAQRATAAYAPREATAHYEKAVEIGIPDDRLAPTLERLAETYYLFDFARSAKASEEAADLYRERGDVRGLSRMLRLRSRNMWQQADPDTAQVIAKEAIAVLDGLEPTVELGRATAHLAQLQMTAAADADAVRTADAAIELGRRFDDAWTISNALITKGSATRRADSAAAQRFMREGIDLARRSGLAETVVRGYNNLVIQVVFSDPIEADRLREEGYAYGRGQGIEQPMLVSQRAFSAWLRGDWDQALSIVAEIPPGSSWHNLGVWVRGWIVVGREGPRAGLDLVREMAEKDAARREVQRSIGPLSWVNVWHLLADDRAAAEAGFARLRRRATEDDGYYVAAAAQGAGPWATLLGAAVDDADWVDQIERHLPADPVTRREPEMTWRLASALVAGDSARCAAELDALSDHARRQRYGSVVGFQLLFCARELERRGRQLGPAWRPLLAAARGDAERVRASWLSAEIAKVEARLQD